MPRKHSSSSGSGDGGSGGADSGGDDRDGREGSRQAAIDSFGDGDPGGEDESERSGVVGEIERAAEAALSDADGGVETVTSRDAVPAAADDLSGNAVLSRADEALLDDHHLLRPDSGAARAGRVRDYLEYVATHAATLGIVRAEPPDGFDYKNGQRPRTVGPQYEVNNRPYSVPEDYDNSVDALDNLTPEDLETDGKAKGGTRGVNIGTVPPAETPHGDGEVVYHADHPHRWRSRFKHERAGYIALEELGVRTPRAAFLEDDGSDSVLHQPDEWSGVSLSRGISYDAEASPGAPPGGVSDDPTLNHNALADDDQALGHIAAQLTIGNVDLTTDNILLTDGKGAAETVGGPPTADDHEAGQLVAVDLDHAMQYIDTEFWMGVRNASFTTGFSEPKIRRGTTATAASIIRSDAYERAVKAVAEVDEINARRLAYNTAWVAVGRGHPDAADD